MGRGIIKSFFFDLDGTLVSTYQADFLAYRDAVREVVGAELEQAKYAALHGMELAAKLALLFPELTDEQVTGIRTSKKKHYRNYLHLTELNEDLVRFLAQFAKHQHCVLVTVAKRDNVAAVLEHHGLARFFTHVVSGDDVTKHKPDPEAYLLALKRTGLQPHEVIAFEDSQSGIESAVAAGIAVVHVKEFAAV